MVCGLYVEHAYDIFITGYLFFFFNQSKIVEYLGGFLHGLHIYIYIYKTEKNIFEQISLHIITLRHGIDS